MKKRRFPKFAVVTSGITLVLLFTIIYTEVSGATAPMVGPVSQVLNPVQRAGYAFNQKVEQSIEFYFNYEDKLAENEALKQEVAELQQKGRMFDDIQQENVELKAIFQYKIRHDEYDYVGTNIISRSTSGLSPTYTLDKGSNDGIRRGMVVITYEGLAGQITQVYPNHSVLETISSENISLHILSSHYYTDLFLKSNII